VLKGLYLLPLGEVHTGFWWGRNLRERDPFRRTKRRLEDNMKTDLQEMVWAGMNWIDLAQDRNRRRGDANAAMKVRVPYDAGNVFTA
jgi:hypothetical protein